VILVRFAVVALAAATLSACAIVPETGQPGVAAGPAPSRGSKGQPPAAKPLPAPVGGTASTAGIRPGPSISELGLTPDRARSALAAFRISCPSLVKRADSSGLTNPQDWAGACAEAAGWPDADAVNFFVNRFETATVGEGQAFATGYYEPEISGSRVRQPGYEVPVYRRPPDLIEVDLGLFSDQWAGKKIRGRVEATRLVPYPDRAAIDDGALAGKGLEIAWAADPVEFFFLQVQGSGRLRLPDGQVMRIGYDGQNGRDYVGIGATMRDRGLLEPGKSSMQGIMEWLRANPDEGRALMRENKSFVFFRKLTGAGPLGALGLPVTGRATVAADPAYVPLGAPVWLALDRPEANGLWVAQDTGGAIKGANRFDTFWGAGDEARRIAGGMSGRGLAWLLLPRGVLARIGNGNGGTAARP
jgi:membrane-bound lytic murein transglycosylase A